jgi:prepilin-type N-terminal cleavage/methylation domain-containing protein/prepilin-type processing-associated H-X9-DG protein
MYLSKWKKAFTLLEMLVVITIIALLSSMLLVSFGKFRKKARETQCMHNMKNIHGMAMLASGDWLGGSYANVSGYYHKQNNEDLWDWKPGWVNRFDIPSAKSNDVVSTTSGKPWIIPDVPGDPAPWQGDDAEEVIRSGKLYKETKARMRTFVCPEFLIKMKDMGVDDAKRSYSMNSQLHRRQYKHMSAGRLSEDAADKQKAGRGFSSYLMFAEMAITNRIGGTQTCERAIFDTANRESGDGVLSGTPKTPLYPVETIGSYHANGRTHVVFMDGHAEKLYPSETTNA